VFYEIASAVTFTGYARCDNCTEATLATIADFFNPLSTPKDLLDLADMIVRK